jgi:hypothetical protein
MLNWRDKYGRNYDNIDIFIRVRFTFTTEIRGYLGSIRNALSFIDLSRKAKFYLDLFQDKVFEDSEAKMMWLLACLEDIPDITFLLHAKINQYENYITFSKINVDLALMKDYLKLQKLFNELHNLLPYTILNHFPWDWKDSSQPDKNEDPVFGDNDEDLPF